MLRLKKNTLPRAARVTGLTLTFALALAAGAARAQSSSSAPAQAPAQQPSQTVPQATAAPGTAAAKAGTRIAPVVYTGPSYDNRWEVYGGLALMNGQAGQVQPNRRYNMGGADVLATYWLNRRFGIDANYRFGAGTTPVLSPYYNRVVVFQNIFAGGAQYRWLHNRYVALDLHALAGATDGVFDHATRNYPGGSPVSACAANQQPGQQGNLGLYCNGIAPWAAAGGSIDFNYSRRFAVRFSPDLTFEHFGTETREFVSLSLGAVYRFGKVK